MASWLVCLSADRAVRVRALAGGIALCSWARHFTLTVPLSTQVYEWVPVVLDEVSRKCKVEFKLSHLGLSIGWGNHWQVIIVFFFLGKTLSYS